MKRKLLSILLALCVMLTLFPTMALAEEPAAHANHNVCCCDTGCTDPNHSEHAMITDWQAVTDTLPPIRAIIT